MLPGYSASAAADVTAATAAPCSDNRYRNGTAAYSTRGVPCLACPPNMQTYIGKAGASSSDNCLVPPGFGWRPASGDAAICGAGMVRNRQAHALCSSSWVAAKVHGSVCELARTLRPMHVHT